MDIPRGPGEDHLDVVRALLLLQGSILVVTTIEAVFWGVIFAGAGSPAVLSGAAAVMILIARARLRADRRWSRRVIYGVEGLTLAFLVVDGGLAIAIAGALPRVVALLTRLLLPLSVIALLRRSARAAAAAVPVTAVATLRGAS